MSGRSETSSVSTRGVRSSVGGLAVALLVGCGPQRPPEPATGYAPDGEPLTIIAFEDDTTWPFEIERVVVALDGTAIIRHASPVGDDTKWEFSVPFAALPHGDHTLTISVDARFATTRMDASEGCGVRVRDARSFVTSGEPVGVRIVAETGGMTRRFIDRLDVGIAMVGTRSAEGYQGKPDRVLKAPISACRDDGPLPFSDDELGGGRFGPDLLR